MDHWWFVPTAVGAALAFGTSTHLKHLSAADVPTAHTLGPGAVGRLIRATISHRLWLTGICADVVGVSLQVVALHLGPLSAVQPLLVSGLLIALLIRQRSNNRLDLGEIAWGALLTATLAALVLLTGIARDPLSPADPAPAGLAAGIGVVLTTCCLILARSQGGSRRAAALLGVAVGGVYATTAALVKVTTDVGAQDPVSILWHWQFYVAIALGAAGLVLNQLAFRAGPLTASLPATSAVDPLISVLIGIWVFDEHPRTGIGPTIAFFAVLIALTFSVVKLTRIQPQPARSGSAVSDGAAIMHGRPGDRSRRSRRRPRPRRAGSAPRR